MVVTKHVEETSFHEKSFWGGRIHRGWWNLDLRRELIPVNGQPAIGKEAELFASLEVVDDDVAEIPGLHLADSTVVMPDLEAHQMTQRPGMLIKFHKVGFVTCQLSSRMCPKILFWRSSSWGQTASESDIWKDEGNSREIYIILNTSVAWSSPDRINWTLDWVPWLGKKKICMTTYRISCHLNIGPVWTITSYM